jgi:ribosomal protein L40E
MNEGLLWLDADPKRDLAEKVARAANRYRVKFGCRPTTCYVNADQWPGIDGDVGGVRLVAVDNVLKHHFWIGVDGMAEHDRDGVLVCRRCGAESLDPQAANCWACGWDGKE